MLAYASFFSIPPCFVPRICVDVSFNSNLLNIKYIKNNIYVLIDKCVYLYSQQLHIYAYISMCVYEYSFVLVWIKQKPLIMLIVIIVKNL